MGAMAVGAVDAGPAVPGELSTSMAISFSPHVVPCLRCLFGSICVPGTAGAGEAEGGKGVRAPEQRTHWE